MTPLYGHTSPETAYVIPDYPYGFRLRCKLRAWLEFKPGKGWRFVTQTTNPKVTYGEVWNKPKASTYVDTAACIYLDEADENKLKWTGIGDHTSAVKTLEFILAFPGADFRRLRPMAAHHCKPGSLLARLSSGDKELVWSINGVPQVKSEAERSARKAEYAADLATWMRINELLS